MIFLNSDKFQKNFLSKYRYNLKNILKVSYKRSYFIDPKKKIRVTLDQNIIINKKYLNNKFGISLDKNIIELKYDVADSNYCNELILNSKLENRNNSNSLFKSLNLIIANGVPLILFFSCIDIIVPLTTEVFSLP